MATLYSSPTLPTTIAGCRVWLDSNNPKNVDPAIEANAASPVAQYYADSTSVATIVGRANLGNNSVTQAAGSVQAVFKTNIMGGKPILRFTASSFTNYPINLDFLAGRNYSVIYVEQRSSSKSSNYIIAGTTGNTNENLILGYANDTTLMFSQYANDLTATIPAYTSPIPRIHVATFDSSYGKQYYLNGQLVIDSITADAKTPLTTNTGSYVGCFFAATQFYQGDIAELIVYDRCITADEITAMHQYLHNKWAISIS